MIKRFHDYITEKLGVSDVTLVYTDIILDYIKHKFDDIYFNDEKKQKLEIILQYNYINRHISSKDKLITNLLPIKELFIDFELIKGDPDCDEETPFKTTGVCYEFTKLNKVIDIKSKKSGIFTDKDNLLYIHPRIGLKIYLGKEYKTSRDKKKLFVEFESTISHELNHLMEGYNRFTKQLSIEDDIDPTIGIVAVKNPDEELISDELFDRWVDFTYLLYYSGPHEVNAVSQESLSYILTNTPLEEIPGWEIQRKLNEFDKDDYYKEMLKLAKNDESKLELLKDSFAEKFRKLLVSQGRLLNNRYVTKHDIEFILKSSFKSFINRYSRIISKQGARLKKNILRLHSYEKD